MSDAKHTPGPWIIGTRPDGSRWFSIGDPRTGPHYQADIFCGDADARLIAAAPELLAAVEALSKIITDMREDEAFDASSCDAGGILFGDVASEAIEAANAAIAKAGAA
jgi:hypothetical protein